MTESAPTSPRCLSCLSRVSRGRGRRVSGVSAPSPAARARVSAPRRAPRRPRPLRSPRTTLSMYSPSRVRARWKPGVSISTSWVSPRFIIAVMRLRVVWGLLETMATFSPTSALVSVLLPTLGRPAMVIIAFLSIVAAPRCCTSSRELPARRRTLSSPARRRQRPRSWPGSSSRHRAICREKLQCRIYVHEYARERHWTSCGCPPSRGRAAGRSQVPPAGRSISRQPPMTPVLIGPPRSSMTTITARAMGETSSVSMNVDTSPGRRPFSLSRRRWRRRGR